MHVTSRISTLCVAGLLVADLAAANPLLTPRAKGKDTLAGMMPKDIKRGKCSTPNRYNNAAERKHAWIDANGWELADEFMNKNSPNDWAQQMMQNVFPDIDASNFACSDRDAQCINSKDCNEFEEKGWPGVFYIMSAMKNVHTYFSAYLTKMDEMNEELKTDVDSLVKQFGKDVPKYKDLNIGTLFAAALGVASGATAAFAPVSGALGAASGIASIAGQVFKETPKSLPEIQDDTAVVLKEIIQGYVEAAKGEVNMIMDSMFGKGPGEDVIPKQMKFNGGENTDGWVHAITYVLGDGQWLSNDPVKEMGGGLDKMFEETRRRLRQMIAFQLVRVLRNAVLIINDDTPEGKCQGWNKHWDPELKSCYDIMWLEKGWLRRDLQKYAAALWKPESEGGFGMDKAATYANALHCWKANGNKLGDIVMDDITPEKLPRCLFSMEIKKGKYIHDDDDCWVGATIQLDKSFPNFPQGTKDRTNWPQETTQLDKLGC